jgi:hypothetical protein
MRAVFLSLLLLMILLSAPAGAAVCKGEDPCKACKDCTKCGYCNSGKGSCNVKREQSDRDYLKRQAAKQR